MEKLIEDLNNQYPDSGWTIVIRGGMTNDNDDLVMDAAIYTNHPDVTYSKKYEYVVPPFPVAECINIYEIDEVVSVLYKDLNSLDLGG